MNAVVTLPADAVQARDGRPVTHSTKVAEAFDKRHKDVLRSIRDLECSEEFGRRNFTPTSYLDSQGKQQPAYHLTEDGWILLVMGFTGPQAARVKEAYIGAFNALRARLNGAIAAPPPAPALPAPAGAHRMAIDPAEYVDLLKTKIAHLESRGRKRQRHDGGRPVLPAEREQMLTLRRQGQGVNAIARATGRAPSTVRNILQRHPA